jgi:hypothetical protein
MVSGRSLPWSRHQAGGGCGELSYNIGRPPVTGSIAPLM